MGARDAAVPPGALPSGRRLAASTGAALAVAALVLVTAVLPAEYGIDPTGVGRALGFTRLGDTVPAADADVTAPPADARNRTVYRMSAEWTLTRTLVGSFSGTVGELRTERVRFPIGLPNVTSVTATLEWTDDPETGPDELEVSLAGAGRESALSASASDPATGRGNASATLQVTSVPFPRTNGTDAVVFPTGPEDRSAVGEWVATVRAYALGDHDDGREDAAASWTLRIEAEHYALATETDSSGRGDHDAVTITLQPGGDVEYKFEMKEGASMEYRWSSTLPVYSDFHGDTEANPDGFTSYGIETATGDRGNLTAPFDGRHGWYFKNDEDRSLVITLETRGDYRILGAV